MSTPSGSFNGVAMTSYGTYTGTAPSSATGTWTGCGGGSATIQGLGLNPYPVASTGGSSGATGTFFVNYLVASAAGTGCTLTITTNLSTTATTPPTTIFPNAQGTTVTSNIHNAPGWVHSHAYAPANATVTFTNGSANIAWTNVAVAGTPVNFETSGSLPTNFVVGTTYYVIATGLSSSNVQVSATVGGSAIMAGSAGSGTQTGYAGGAHTRVNNGAGWTESTGVWNPGSGAQCLRIDLGQLHQRGQRRSYRHGIINLGRNLHLEISVWNGLHIHHRVRPRCASVDGPDLLVWPVRHDLCLGYL